MNFKRNLLFELLNPILAIAFCFIIGLPFLSLLGFLYLIVCFLRYKFFNISIKENSLEVRSGILIKNLDTVLFSKINKISLEQSLWQKLFKVASISLETGNDLTLVLYSIENFEELHKLINSKIQ